MSIISTRVPKCDIFDDKINGLPDDFESKINILNEIGDSFESEYDKTTYTTGPKKSQCCYYVIIARMNTVFHLIFN
jgi:hypothetical protein